MHPGEPLFGNSEITHPTKQMQYFPSTCYLDYAVRVEETTLQKSANLVRRTEGGQKDPSPGTLHNLFCRYLHVMLSRFCLVASTSSLEGLAHAVVPARA